MTVELRSPFPIESAGKLYRWLNHPRTPNFDDFGPATPRDFAKDFAHRLSREKTWGIYLNGEVVGYLGFAPQSPIAGQFHGLVVSPLFRGRGIGLQTIFAATEELEAAGYRKLMVTTFADNARIKRLFEKVGYGQEGYITAYTVRDGKPLDMRVLCRPFVAGNSEEL